MRNAELGPAVVLKGRTMARQACGLRPVGAIGAYAPEGRRERGKLRGWEDEKAGKREGGEKKVGR